QYADGSGRVRGVSPPIESADVDDDGYPDGLIAQAAVEALQNVQDRPFLLCVGFFKPHLPFCAPKKYFDLYDPDTLPGPPHPDPPVGADPRSLPAGGEVFGNYRHGVEHPQTDAVHHRRLRQAYFACVSYADAQIGKLLDELDRLDLSQNTIVVVWGDHGWHLGDQSLWGKHTLYERSLHSTLIVRTPQLKSPGTAASGLVETVDLYPTLAELCSLSAPQDLEGQTLVPILVDPEHPGKPAALGFWKNDGRTIRTDRYRLIRHLERGSRPAAVELYDHMSDPWESRNIAEHHPEIVAELNGQLDSSGRTDAAERTGR
ncbi:MAG: sulfatase-like hydrolase/transferase, partial [Planctomycetaceae bacterium]